MSHSGRMAWVLVCVVAMAGTAAAQGEAKQMTQEQIIASLAAAHTQGWGVWGMGVAAHSADKPGEPLRIGDTTYTSGLGDHAPSETVLLLEGRYQSFEALCGVQWQGDTGGGAGTVRFRVFADDREVFDSGVMTQTTPARALRVPLEGVAELRLVVEDAGDGLTCDMANWVNPVLKPNPNAPAPTESASVDMAPFAMVAAWDPARLEGTAASRVEMIPEEDLFPETQLLPDSEGVYEAKAYGDGRSCIGLQWVERRRLRMLELEFAQAPASLDGMEVHYWSMTQRGGSPGGSRWQGAWKPMVCQSSRDGDRMTFTPDWTGRPEAQTGALKVRWVFPAGAAPVRVKALRAYTPSRWDEADLVVETAPETTGQGTVDVYNGALSGQATGSPLRAQWALGQPMALHVRYTPARRWELADRTVLRFALPDTGFGVAVDDVVKKGSVYVPHAGLLVRLASEKDEIAAYKKAHGGQETILEQVRALPDQTVAQAMRHTYRPDADLGPTLLSLACDNHKFLVERAGAISFDDDPAKYNSPTPPGKGLAVRIAPEFGTGEPASVSRCLQRDWMPLPVVTVVDDGITYRQRTFVAPYGKVDAAAGTLPLTRYRALGVAEFGLANPGVKEAQASLVLHFTADVETKTAAAVRVEPGRAVVEKNGKLLAVVDLRDTDGLTTTAEDGVLRIAGPLEAKGRRTCVLWMPRWEGAAASDLATVPQADLLAAETEAHWRRAMEDAMQVEVPDDLINKVIPASQMHCMLAARNEEGLRIAPWIGSVHYGPLESEGHSIIRGMMVNGHLDFARRALDYYIARYNDQGFLTTGYTVMGTGWHLWTLGEYYRLSHDAEWLKAQAPRIEQVCKWIMTERRKTMHTDAHGEKVPEYGLLPPGVGADWEVYSYYFYLNGYYCAGLRDAGKALADVGWPGAQEMVSDAEAYAEDIRRAYSWVQRQAPVFELRDGSWVPEYPTQVYSPCPVENLYPAEDAGRSWCYDVELGAHHLIPFGIVPARGPQADWMINHMEDVQFLRRGWFYYEDPQKNEADWFNLGGFAKVQPYYARTGEVHAMRDDVKPFIRTYFNSLMSLLNREDLSLWEHFVNGAFNKTHETGYFLHQSRLMLVQERGEELWLAPFVTSNWLRDGMRVRVANAPTFFGPVGYTVVSHVADGYMEATITPPEREKPSAIVLRLRHPEGKALVSAEVTGASGHTLDPKLECIRLTPAGGPVTIRARFAD